MSDIANIKADVDAHLCMYYIQYCMKTDNIMRYNRRMD